MRSRDGIAWPAAAEVIVGALAAAVGTLLVHGIVVASRFDARDEVAAGLGPVWAAVMVGIALLGYLVQRRAPERARLVVAGLAGLAVGMVMLPLTAGLHGTPQPPFTIVRGDQQFRTEYVTRFASTWHLDDYTFKGLHAFYPPAWFWLAGRAAHVLGVEPWRIIKPFAIGTIGVALALSFALWRRVLTPAAALAAAIGSSLVLTRQVGSLGVVAHSTQGWYSPYSCFVAVVGPAWLAATLAWVQDGAARRRGAVVLVLAGALLALLYYLLFLILVAVLLVLALAPRLERRAAARRTTALLGAIAALTAVFWIPLAFSILKGAASQGHYLSPDFLQVSVGFDGPKALVLLAVAVAASLVLTHAWTPARAVAGLLVGTVLYQLLSVTTLVFSENQLQPHRAVTMMWATLGAAVPVALDGLQRSGVLARALPAPTLRGATALIAAVAVPATFLLGAGQGKDLASGPLTLGARDPVDLRSADVLSRFITQTAGRRPQDMTIVTEARALLITRPYHGFLGLSARYSHPQARQDERVQVLEHAADCPDAACTTRLLLHNRFGPIDAMVLRHTVLGYELGTQVDAFPAPHLVTIDFPPDRLDPAVWTSARFGIDTVFVRTGTG